MIDSLPLLSVTLAGAVTAAVSTPLPAHGPLRSLTLLCDLVVAGGGTTMKLWVQTSFDGGVSWHDIANFALTTATAQRLANLTNVAVTTPVTPTDGTLADNTCVNGLLGPIYRTKLTTTGTYTGASTLKIWAIPG